MLNFGRVSFWGAHRCDNMNAFGTQKNGVPILVEGVNYGSNLLDPKMDLL